MPRGWIATTSCRRTAPRTATGGTGAGAAVLERVIERLRLPARARILDAGCGSGRNMVELARHGTVTGIELSQTSVALARARSTGEVIEGSVLQMPFESRASTWPSRWT